MTIVNRKKTEIFAHRGSKSNRPENTLASFREAIRTGCDGIELDVHLSKDQQLVVIHDETVDRTTNGSGYVRDFTAAELQQLDAGSWFAPEYAGLHIPLLSEVLDMLVDVNYRGILNIEVKTDKYKYPNIELILHNMMQRQKWPFRYLYCSFNIRSLSRLHKLDTKIELDVLSKNNPIKIAYAERLHYIEKLHIRHSYYFQWRKYLKKPCRIWTTNRKKVIKSALKKEVTGIITDYPERAMELRQKIQGS